MFLDSLKPNKSIKKLQMNESWNDTYFSDEVLHYLFNCLEKNDHLEIFSIQSIFFNPH